MVGSKTLVLVGIVVLWGSHTVLAQGQSNALDAKQETELFELATTRVKAVPGQFVLCPSRQFYDRAMSEGADRASFIYYAARMQKSGEQTSTVKNLAGRVFDLPNYLIIPIAPGQQAKVGDILLTWWQSGSGMQRAIVTGGTPTEPVVRYLDIKLDNPSGAGKKEETLKPDTFVVLSKPFQMGTTVTVKTERGRKHGQLVAADAQRVLLREFAGKMGSYPRSACDPIPLVPNLKANDIADAALYGTMKPVSVDKVDATIGRVFATFQLGRKDRQIAFAFGDIMKATETK